MPPWLLIMLNVIQNQNGNIVWFVRSLWKNIVQFIVINVESNIEARCCDEYDHHCFLLGNCIGKNNKKYFLIYLISSAFACFWIFSFSSMGFYIAYIKGVIWIV